MMMNNILLLWSNLQTVFIVQTQTCNYNSEYWDTNQESKVSSSDRRTDRFIIVQKTNSFCPLCFVSVSTSISSPLDYWYFTHFVCSDDNVVDLPPDWDKHPQNCLNLPFRFWFLKLGWRLSFVKTPDFVNNKYIDQGLFMLAVCLVNTIMLPRAS